VLALSTLWNALVFALLGIVVFAGAALLVIRLLPGDLWRRAVEERDTAAAIVLASLLLALAWIVAAAVH